jgi:hypothetical protein
VTSSKALQIASAADREVAAKEAIPIQAADKLARKTRTLLLRKEIALENADAGRTYS